LNDQILHQDNQNIIEGLFRDIPQAMKSLYELYYKPLCVYAVRYVVSMPVAEEVVSDVMYKIWQNRHGNFRADSFREYLFTATRNTALNYLKQQQQQQNLSESWADRIRGELIEESPLDLMITEEMQSKLRHLMETLPEQCRKAFLMSRMEDMTYEEIADEMDISPNTVKHHIKTALQKLRIGMSNFAMWILLFLSFFYIFFIHTPILFLFSIVLVIYHISNQIFS